jgi:glycosyltransferase involved in cell wall biosynthesis
MMKIKSTIDKKKFTIDVIIPTYNCSNYILNAIKSIEEQTYIPEKIIVVDDGSSDNTIDIVANYKSSIIVEYYKKENGGPNSARNLALKYAKSDFVAFLDADDEWEINKLEEQINVFTQSKYNNLGVVYCNYSMIDEKGNYTDKYLIYRIDTNWKGMIYDKLLLKNYIISSASGVLIKRECFEKTGLFDETLRIGEDWDMWLRISEFYSYDFSEKELVKIRRHSNNAQNNQNYYFSNLLIFYNKWINILQKSYPKEWKNHILSLLISDSRINIGFLKMCKNIDKNVKKIIFDKTFGALKLFLVLKLIFSFFENYFKSFFSLIKDILLILTKG